MSTPPTLLLCVLAGLAVPNVAAGQQLRHEDHELARPDLKVFTATTYKMQRGRFVVKLRERRTYDKKGHIKVLRHEKPNGALVTETRYAWDARGNLTSRSYRDHTGARARRTFRYKYDAQGRITERIMRDPKKKRGTYYRSVYSWNKNGSHSIRTNRHYPTEGPYRDGSKSIDAAGRVTTSCSVSGCSMTEYDARGNVGRVRHQHGPDHFYIDNENHYDKSGRLVRRKRGGTDIRYVHNKRGDVIRKMRKFSGKVEERTDYRYRYR